MDIVETADQLATRMSQQLRIRGAAGLADVAAKAGRKLPKYLQADVRVVVESAEMARHPKLGRHVDAKRVAKAARRIEAFLAKHDPKAERRGEILDRIAAVAFVLFSLAVILFFILLSRGAFDRG